ncbi:hypothetical protein 1 [Hubei picorna-like virus 4]|uniref:hypothetical protein 1 n=1 Tax=Hubei picorna-like virus 4 TaxID=1923120 RepID=UPI00090CD863|nr:hypothetical protein 1 [Hubei picorna-like virus 4]APG78400.1 hypothetical protein 1 [Hubei picorna-like virus 4]
MTEYNDIELRFDLLTKARVELHAALVDGDFWQYCQAVDHVHRIESHTDTTVRTKKIWPKWAKLSFKRNKVHLDSNGVYIFLITMDQKRTLYVGLDQTIGQVCAMHNIVVRDAWFSMHGKPIRPDVSLGEHGVQANSTITQHFRMLGGCDIAHRVYTHVYECEQQVLAQEPQFILQSEAISHEEHIPEDFLSALMDAVASIHAMLPKKHLWLGELLENFFQMAYWTRKCESKSDYAACVALSYKLLTGRSVGVTLWTAFKGDDLQADTFTKLTQDARDMFNVASTVINNPLMKKIKQIYTYLLVQGFLSKVGKNMEVEEFLTLEKKVRPNASSTSMILLVIDVALQICERIDAYRLTGDWHSLIHDDAAYTAWVADAERIINLAPFTSNLAAHGTTYFKFVSDLQDAIEKGEAVCKYSCKNSGVESSLMRKRLNSLQLLKNVEVTRRSSQKERKAPFGVLIHGNSSVGKSSFTKMLFYYYGRIHGLEVDDHYRYVRSPTDEYWSNFDSSKWCIQMDDIAFLLPSKSSDVDPTLKEMLNVVNNVPYVPPQAALEDKGKTPVLARLVLATSNAADLNALEYFHCPLAVRRRLPYVIHVAPKQEYIDANGKFLDPAKLPESTGEFPDFWDIEIQKLVPVDHTGRDSAELVVVERFSNVKQFLKHFAAASIRHENTQEKSEACDQIMRNVKVCRLCYEIGDDCACLQAMTVTPVARVAFIYAAAFATDILSSLTLMFICTSVYMWFARFYMVRQVTARWTRLMNAGVELRFHSLVNNQRERRFKISVEHLLKAGVIITKWYLCYKAGQFVVKHTTTAKPPVVVEQADSTEEEGKCSLQGNVHGSTEEQLQKEETRNVWYNPTLELSSFDVPLASKSLADYTPSEVRDLFAANCVRIDVRALDEAHAMRMSAVYIRGQYLLFNRHAIAKGTRFKMTITTQATVGGINSNIETFFDRSEVQEDASKDIAVLRVRNAPPRKDILKFWNTACIPVSYMVSVKRTPGGTVEYGEVFNVQHLSSFPIEALGVSMNVYMGMYTCETKVGDCGSLGVAMTPRGPVVVGIHTLGYKSTAGFPHVTRSDLEALCVELETSIEGVGTPTLALHGEVVLGPIHHKSMLRYIPDGTANVYGNLPGFRAKPRSRVKATPLQERMLEHFGIEVSFGAPVMQGWEPMYKNVVEMVRPHTDIDQCILDHCVQAYAQDVVRELNKVHGDAWKAELLTLSRRASVNGLPGVKYIDRLNINTSMGHPWNKTKKEFLVPAPDDVYPEGVDFTQEVWDRVEAIEAKYKLGQRAYPVFTGHLKDEAVALAKIEAKKTRVFTGAPIDWSLVVRSRLLTFVRLLQKNKLIFEAAPGTVAQSVEWTQFHTYLTEHGEDRIIAGDYSKFDKHMIASFVLGSFDVIAAVYKEAGFSNEEIRVIKAIGYDTAFPVCNMDGSIIEMFGTNPSGQPLTVINNSMANSLYMRYAYCKLNPDGTCWDFKTRVNLLTYGDDNVMGVHPSAPWFYHGAIQTALEKIGVGYTMADKEAETRPYINISECSFLKRSWRMEEELGMYTCPLEEASIHKSLTVWTPSATIDKYRQMVQVIVAANNEYFFYGKDTFEKHHSFFAEILKEEPYNLYTTSTTLLGWDDLIDRFQKASEAIFPTN